MIFMYLSDRIGTIKKALGILKLGKMSFSLGKCPLCKNMLFVKLRDNDPLAIRCVKCRASIAYMAMGHMLQEKVPDFEKAKIYELSSRGAFFEFIKKRCRNLTFSEFYDDIAPGEFKGNVLCQDVQCLTFDDDYFDTCTSTEVFEHIPDDKKGFSEIYRVLRKNSAFIFTVPLNLSAKTVERAELKNDKIINLLPPKYHDDRIRGKGTVLCFRDYGYDITERLKNAGFERVEIVKYKPAFCWQLITTVIIAYK